MLQQLEWLRTAGRAFLMAGVFDGRPAVRFFSRPDLVEPGLQILAGGGRDRRAEFGGGGREPDLRRVPACVMS